MLMTLRGKLLMNIWFSGQRVVDFMLLILREEFSPGPLKTYFHVALT